MGGDNLVLDLVGWFGSILILVAYGLNSYRKIESDSLIYYALNITGGVCMIVYSVYMAAFPNMFINVVWVLVAIPAIIGVFKRKKF